LIPPRSWRGKCFSAVKRLEIAPRMPGRTASPILVREGSLKLEVCGSLRIGGAYRSEGSRSFLLPGGPPAPQQRQRIAHRQKKSNAIKVNYRRFSLIALASSAARLRR
jgi:hypothetical protein